MYEINATVARNIPLGAEKIAPAVYYMAVRCDTYEEAYTKWLLKIKDRLLERGLVLVKPWKRTEAYQQKILSTTSHYSKNQSCPICALEFVEHPTCICG